MTKRNYSQMSSSQVSEGLGMQALMDYMSSSPHTPTAMEDVIMLAIPQLLSYSSGYTLTQTEEEDPDYGSRVAYLKWLVKPSRIYRSSPLLK